MTLIRQFFGWCTVCGAMVVAFMISEDHIGAALWFIGGGVWGVMMTLDELLSSLRRGFVTRTMVREVKEVKREA